MSSDQESQSAITDRSSISRISTSTMESTVGENNREVASPEQTAQKQNVDPEKQEHGQQRQNAKDKVPHWRLVLSQTLVTDAVINHQYKGFGTEDDSYLVEFIPNDPRNPMEFSQAKKWFIVMTVAFATLAVAFVFVGVFWRDTQNYHGLRHFRGSWDFGHFSFRSWLCSRTTSLGSFI